MACKKDEAKIVGFEVSGTPNYSGTYMEDVTYTKGSKYICQENENFVLMDRTINDEELWILLVYNNTYYYKTPKTSTYPPESGWTCGAGLDKPDFKVTPIYE